MIFKDDIRKCMSDAGASQQEIVEFIRNLVTDECSGRVLVTHTPYSRKIGAWYLRKSPYRVLKESEKSGGMCDE